MDCPDLLFLDQEKFDFDVSMSSASSNGDEDEDEVFVETAGHDGRRVSARVETQLGGGGLRTSWSPLSGDQLEAVCQEAHRLANQLQAGELKRSHIEDEKDHAVTSAVTSAVTAPPEEFVQDSEAKLNVFEQPVRVLSPIKRETFCVQDSPLKQLPPAIQRRLLRGSSGANPVAFTRSSITPSSARRASANPPSLARPASVGRLSTSSPVARARPQPKAGLRGKAPLGAVLPSKPTAPMVSASTSRSRVERTRLQPPRPVGGRKGSPARRAESSEDLLSDSASVASDVSDSSINSSLLGKRSLAPPTKGAVKKLPVVKASPLQSRRVMERKNTSSSSSSVSSFNSSMSLSPAKGKLNSSLNRTVSSSSGPAPSSIGRPVNPGRARRSTVNASAVAAEPAPSAAGRRSLSTQAKKVTPLKRAEGTPTKRVLEKSGPMAATSAALPQGGLKGRAKPEALVLPTPSGAVRGLNQGEDSKMLKPKRLVSMGSTESLPQKPSAGPLTPSAGSYKPLQVKKGRPSALPTPVRRRMSSIPVATPTNQTKLAKPPPKLDTDLPPGSSSADKDLSCSLSSTDALEPEPDDPNVEPEDPSVEPDDPSIQPFSLEEEEEEELPAVPSSSPPQPDQSESAESGATEEERMPETRNLIELETTEENAKTQEVLLLDLPAPTVQPQEKLLIDLSNTPNLIRTSNKSCTSAQQLIDLSSPLIKWSPETKSENTAPLINLSF